MRKAFKVFGVVFVALFIAIQFVQPARNLGAAPGEDPRDLLATHKPPAEVRAILERACYDCHSNRTRYPWYAGIQPGAWWLAQHVRDAKRELNFSEFGGLTPKRAAGKLDECIDAVAAREMPLPSYTWAHRDARLSEAEIKVFVEWAETLRDAFEDADEKR